MHLRIFFNKPRTLLTLTELNVWKPSSWIPIKNSQKTSVLPLYAPKGNYSNKCIHTTRSTALSNLIVDIKQSRKKISKNGSLQRFCAVKFEKLYSTSSPSKAELKKQIQELTDQFMEAKELMQDARESMGTVYFTEDMEEAQQAVKDTLEQYQRMLSGLSEEQRQEVLRTIGLKMEELKAQEQALEEALKDDH